MMFLFCVALWFILRGGGVWRGASCFKVFPYSLSSCFFISFSSVIIRSGKRELVYVPLVHLFVCLLHVLVSVLFLFLFVSGVGCGL